MPSFGGRVISPDLNCGCIECEQEVFTQKQYHEEILNDFINNHVGDLCKIMKCIKLLKEK